MADAVRLERHILIGSAIVSLSSLIVILREQYLARRAALGNPASAEQAFIDDE